MRCHFPDRHPIFAIPPPLYGLARRYLHSENRSPKPEIIEKGNRPEARDLTLIRWYFDKREGNSYVRELRSPLPVSLFFASCDARGSLRGLPE